MHFFLYSRYLKNSLLHNVLTDIPLNKEKKKKKEIHRNSTLFGGGASFLNLTFPILIMHNSQTSLILIAVSPKFQVWVNPA